MTVHTSTNRVYPTKAEILSGLYIPSQDELDAINKWRLEWYDSKFPEKLRERLEIEWENSNNNDRWSSHPTLEHWEDRYPHGWRYVQAAQKWVALNELVQMICSVRSIPAPPIVAMDQPWGYYKDKGVIVGSHKNPSIISTLHELGHHIFGSSELEACRFSVGIFSACFPEAYAKLNWRGHQLFKG